MPWDGGAPAGLAPVATTGPADSPGPAAAVPTKQKTETSKQRIGGRGGKGWAGGRSCAGKNLHLEMFYGRYRAGGIMKWVPAFSLSFRTRMVDHD